MEFECSNLIVAAALRHATEKATWKLIVVYLVLDNVRKIQC